MQQMLKVAADSDNNEGDFDYFVQELEGASIPAI